LSLCTHCGYSHKIVAIIPMYELGIMAYDVAVIRCIVVALERNMSCPWLIVKGTNTYMAQTLALFFD